jgi:hypothetical protein
MKKSLLGALSALIVILLIVGFFIIYKDNSRLPFRSNPHYELTAYYLIDSDINDSIIELRGRLYATFDNHGNCKLIQNYSDKMIFNQFKIHDSLTTKLNNYFQASPTKNRLSSSYSSGMPALYSGPDLRINYINDTIVKTIDFQPLEWGDRIPLTDIFDIIYSFTIKNKRNQFLDTLSIKELRLKMLNSINLDKSADLSMTSNYNWKRIQIQ